MVRLASIPWLFVLFVGFLSISVSGDLHLRPETEQNKDWQKQSILTRLRKVFPNTEEPSGGPQKVSPLSASAQPQGSNILGKHCVTYITATRTKQPSFSIDMYYLGKFNARAVYSGYDWSGTALVLYSNKTHWFLANWYFYDTSPKLYAMGKETTADVSQVKTWLLPSGQSKAPYTTKCAAVAKVSKQACTTQLNVSGFNFPPSYFEPRLDGLYWYGGVFNGLSYYQAFSNGSSSLMGYVYFLDSRWKTGWCLSENLGSSDCAAFSDEFTDAEPTAMTRWDIGYWVNDRTAVMKCIKGTTAKCAKFKCGSGYLLKDNAPYLTCKANKCSAEECCHATSCANFSCPPGHVLRTDAKLTPCWGFRCQQEECCRGVCSFDCETDYTTPMENPPSQCRNYNCEFEECCELIDGSHPAESSGQ